MNYALEITQEVNDLLVADAPVAFGVSGGKDSAAMVLATNAYLDQVGHRGPRILIHSDLGRLEWKASLPMCERLASRVGLDLIVVRRQAGDLMGRWLTRWENNVERYRNLECVRLILPWSTAAMPFCRSELKTAIICRDLVERFPQTTIISAVGLRRDESPTRAQSPIFMHQYRLTSATFGTQGFNWLPILSWTRTDVLAYHEVQRFPLHEAYTVYGVSRVSCVCCVLEKYADLVAALMCPENHDIYRDELVPLEILSTFSFQPGQWLADIAPHLLSEQTREALRGAKRRAKLREEAEARIPRHLLYHKGWPSVIPTWDEARLLADVRHAVASAVGITLRYTEPAAIIERHAELMEIRRLREAEKARRSSAA